MIDNLFIKPLSAYKNIFINFSVYTYNIVLVPWYDEAQYKINDKINYEILANKAGRSSEATIYQ